MSTEAGPAGEAVALLVAEVPNIDPATIQRLPMEVLIVLDQPLNPATPNLVTMVVPPALVIQGHVGIAMPGSLAPNFVTMVVPTAFAPTKPAGTVMLLSVETNQLTWPIPAVTQTVSIAVSIQTVLK